MTILCFGDSNTFGYDSRSHLGDRYPKEVRWTGLLAAYTGWVILEAGQNGREIPCRPWELDDLTHRARQADITVIMLGSNDLLLSPDFQAEDVSLRMEVCLSHLLQTRTPASLLLIAPPPMAPGRWVARRSPAPRVRPAGQVLPGSGSALGHFLRRRRDMAGGAAVGRRPLLPRRTPGFCKRRSTGTAIAGSTAPLIQPATISISAFLPVLYSFRYSSIAFCVRMKPSISDGEAPL